MEQYLQCIDYTLWEIVENSNAPIVTKIIDGKETVIPPTSVEEKAQRRAELKARSTLLMALPNEHQLKFNSYKDTKTRPIVPGLCWGEWGIVGRSGRVWWSGVEPGEMVCQLMNQNCYNFNSSGFDQTPPPQSPVIHPPLQETSIKILHDQENVVNSVQTFLWKFNRYSFFETPKVLLLAWDRVFKIKDAFGNKQYNPEDIQELFRKLLDDVQNIHEELAEYINTLGWNHHAFYDDDDDDDVDYTIAIAPVLSTEKPGNSLSMGDEHLDTISATESDKVIKSSVEELVLIPSESEGILDTMCDVHLVNNPTPLEATTHFEIFINSNDDYSSSDDDTLYYENIEYVEASPRDSELVSLEVERLLSWKMKRLRMIISVRNC
uniref:Uncharacterized protein n=1 Tax=Tanacetum cinerariifolium TaxID=118510 RepID=A0A6L2NUM2_TANCI|nr:hypothetical protein [Tanacetum cinerariifolium]